MNDKCLYASQENEELLSSGKREEKKRKLGELEQQSNPRERQRGEQF